MVSRNMLAPSPSVIRPTASTTVTSPTWRVVSLTLTSLPPFQLAFAAYTFHSAQRTRRQRRACALFADSSPVRAAPCVLHQFHFGADWRPLAHLKLVHERLHHQQAPSRLPHQVFILARIG